LGGEGSNSKITGFDLAYEVKMEKYIWDECPR
jgi:hypothetical protein